ncbi:MAG: TatD family hydrolase [Candidatus Moranbacteria bacterium]|jgi:TatD DNase family protein|nr:TatD family hydrolase [Candidatus Moranbacteria bacterium]
MHDIHTHLYWHSYDADRDAVIERARAVGVEKLFVIGCTLEESRQCVALSEQYPDMYAAVGIHPHEMNHLGERPNTHLSEWMAEIRTLARHEKVVAIGECGLDYYSPVKGLDITAEQKKFQREGFLAQIALAQEAELPLIVHCRTYPGQADAYEDMFEILQSHVHLLTAVILHCYMGDTEVTKKFLTLPTVSFSFTGNITYPVKKSVVGTKDDLQETVKMIPLERLFTETDCPFLTPQSKRGERNEPAYVSEVVRQIATLKHVETEVVTETIDRTIQHVFFNASGV